MCVPYLIPLMQFKCLLMPFVSLLLIELLNQNSSKHFFFFYSIIQTEFYFLSCINLYTGLLFYLTQYRIFNTKFVFDVLMCGV